MSQQQQSPNNNNGKPKARSRFDLSNLRVGGVRRSPTGASPGGRAGRGSPRYPALEDVPSVRSFLDTSDHTIDNTINGASNGPASAPFAVTTSAYRSAPARGATAPYYPSACPADAARVVEKNGDNHRFEPSSFAQTDDPSSSSNMYTSIPTPHPAYVASAPAAAAPYSLDPPGTKTDSASRYAQPDAARVAAVATTTRTATRKSHSSHSPPIAATAAAAARPQVHLYGQPSQKSRSLEDDYPQAGATWDAMHKALPAVAPQAMGHPTVVATKKSSSSLLDDDEEDEDEDDEGRDQVFPMTDSQRFGGAGGSLSRQGSLSGGSLKMPPRTASATTPSVAPSSAETPHRHATFTPGSTFFATSATTVPSTVPTFPAAASSWHATPFSTSFASSSSSDATPFSTSFASSSSSDATRELGEAMLRNMAESSTRVFANNDDDDKAAEPPVEGVVLGSSVLHPDAAAAKSSSDETEEETQLRLATEASLKESTPALTEEVSMTDDMLDTAEENARTLQSICRQGQTGSVDPSILEYYLTMCTRDQDKISHSAVGNLTIDKVDKILAVNELLLTAIETGQDYRKSMQKKPALTVSESLAIVSLVAKKDIFSLICMLRAQQDDQRLEAAMALMNFARDAEREGASEEDRRLRSEILSSGGMHSLLTLFRARSSMYELKVVVALAMACILPSFVMSSSTQLKPGLGLKIMECLRFLSTAREVTPRGVRIPKEESMHAAALGLSTFWVNQLEPLIRSQRDLASPDSIQPLRSSSVGYRRARSSTPGQVFDQRKDEIGTQELLEMTVSLIIEFADYTGAARNGREIDPVLLVEQICAIEAARPIAVREGVLKILVEWIEKGGDGRKRLAAAHSLRYLTSIQDKYMAGWIHSQMVNEGALPAIVNLSRDAKLGPQIRLAIAQILSSLCVAPHTRAAVVEADCIHFLVDILFEHETSGEVALFAAQALLQLAAGAITRATALGGDDIQSFTFVSPDKRDKVVDDIVERGAIGSLVEIALQHKGTLRAVAIESLRVLSEDISPIRRTRLKLCDDGAARAIGTMLTDTLPSVEDALSRNRNVSHDDMHHLHEALCALSNFLDPLTYNVSTKTRNSRQLSDGRDACQLQVAACIDTLESGGLDSLIRIALFEIDGSASYGPSGISTFDLLAEACRSISSISPLLLSKEVSVKRLSYWAGYAFQTLDCVLHRLTKVEEEEENEAFIDVHVSLLQGISALAKSAPLKIRIIDRILPHLLEAKNSQDRRDISNASSQAFQSLDLAEDEVAHQVAGNSASLLADWFCLQRSLLIQGMARKEIRDTVLHLWEEPFRESTASTGPTRLARDVSDRSKSDDDKSTGTYFFENMVFDDIPSKEIQDILKQYVEMFGHESPRGGHRTILDNRVAASSSPADGLLHTQIYPLDSTTSETEWLLRHQQYLQSTATGRQQLTDHVETLLETCFPSRLIRDHVIPIKSLRSDASFNFRAFMMPQRRYFSFRREGQLLSRICSKEEEPENVHWTLGFTNSSFAGEFSESLVQALYLCPMITGVSFTRNKQWYNVKKSQEEEDTASDDGVSLLGTIVGSLPPWIANLTFDGLLGDKELRALVMILDAMGKLSAGPRANISPIKGDATEGEPSQSEGQNQGRFWCVAIRNCTHLSQGTWQDFFGLIGKVGRGSKSLSRRPLFSLKSLDLSGNGLGDDLCSSLMELVLDKESGCKIEQLDLSGNRLANATRTLKVIRHYVQRYRSDQFQGIKSRSSNWRAPLSTLLLASNGLHLDSAWLELISLLKNNAFPLKTLDLSSNKIALTATSYETDSFLSCLLKNTALVNLRLSDNRISHEVIDEMINRLGRSTIDMGLAFLDLSENQPPVTDRQLAQLQSFCTRSRKTLVQRMTAEKERNESSRRSMLGTSELSVSYPSERRLGDGSGYAPDDDPSSFNPSYPSSRGLGRVSAPGDNMITVLFSAPLVYKDRNGVLRPFAKLDFDMERELIMGCLKEASREIELSFDTATHHRLLAAISKGCSCLHYSGHGHERFLPFEDGQGGPHWFEVDNIRSLIASREGGSPFRFVFVSACYSELAGSTFASAGVPHVVCCKQQFELKDTAALAFTRQFYLALAVGHTVKEAFEQGRKAVRATPNLRDAESETEKFVLLPRDGNHDVPIFDAKPLIQWPHASSSRRRKIKSNASLSVFNKMQEDPSTSPPQFFLGREVDMYLVLNLILEKRLVSVVGEAGVGRSSLACALCHFINERATTISQIDHILYVKVRQSRKQSRVRALVQKLVKRLVEANKIDPNEADVGPDVDIESVFDAICQALRDSKCLIVFDRTELLKDSDEMREFPMLLSNLFRETRHVKVLLTGLEPLGIPSIGGQVEHHYSLGCLTYADTVQLFSRLCPYIHTPLERRSLFAALVTDGEESVMLSNDAGLSDSTRKIFQLLGGGIPAKIEKAAYVMNKDDVMVLMSGSQNLAYIKDLPRD